MKHIHVAVIYDSIHNSVFHGQVLQPLVAMLAHNPKLHVYLVSFETRPIQQSILISITQHSPRLQIIIIKKTRYIGRVNLWIAAWQLKKLVRQFDTYTLQARGPLAGYVCAYALNPQKCSSLLIQARGLLAAEYEYAHRNEKNVCKKLLHALRYKQLLSLERAVYGPLSNNAHTTIEAVSPALKEYVVTTCHANPQRITVAHQDMPPTHTAAHTSTWRDEVRAQLCISAKAIVYCYNGSIKPWQCPRETIEYFLRQHATNPHAFLLVLTPDVHEFTALINKYGVSHKSYAVHKVPHNHIYRYLAACDVGMLWREPHIINWTSRPTKMLEYQAVNLTIAHNNTIAWLANPGSHMPAQNQKRAD